VLQALSWGVSYTPCHTTALLRISYEITLAAILFCIFCSICLFFSSFFIFVPLLQALRPELERQLPMSLLRGVRGLALLSVMRVGAGWSCTAGTGLVVARQRNGTW
jgi:hypothetical protein